MFVFTKITQIGHAYKRYAYNKKQVYGKILRHSPISKCASIAKHSLLTKFNS